MREILRIVVAVVFILSGFVKAVDPKGFAFKLEEYFSPSVFNLPFLEKFSLALAIVIVAIEFLLGVMLLLKIRVRRALWILFAMCVFFAFLTFYSAYFNVVTDCGCFGDALKLTPWGSFTKDIILLLLIIILLRQYSRGTENGLKLHKSNFVKLITFSLSCVLLLIFIIGGVIGEPLIDFRDYKIGTDLNAVRKKIEENPAQYKVIYTLKNLKTGEEKAISQDDYISSNIWENEDWEIQSDKTEEKMVKEGFDSEIKQFRILNPEGEDITENILSAPKMFMVFSYRPEKLSPSKIQGLEKGMQNLKKKGYQIIAVSTDNDIFSNVPHGTMDATAIKTIGRSNPFILILEKGKIIFKHEARNYFNK